MKNGLLSQTYCNLLELKDKMANQSKRYEVKVMLASAFLDRYHPGGRFLSLCPSAYDKQVYTPFSMKMERKILGI